MRGELNDKLSSAIHTARLQEFHNVSPTRATTWEDHVLTAVTLGMWSLGWTANANYDAVDRSPALTELHPIVKGVMATGLTAGDVTGTRDIVEGLRGADTLNTRSLTPEESLSKVVTGSVTATTMILGEVAAAEAPAVAADTKEMTFVSIPGQTTRTATAAEGQRWAYMKRIDAEVGTVTNAGQRPITTIGEKREVTLRGFGPDTVRTEHGHPRSQVALFSRGDVPLVTSGADPTVHVVLGDKWPHARRELHLQGETFPYPREQTAVATEITAQQARDASRQGAIAPTKVRFEVRR